MGFFDDRDEIPGTAILDRLTALEGKPGGVFLIRRNRDRMLVPAVAGTVVRARLGGGYDPAPREFTDEAGAKAYLDAEDLREDRFTVEPQEDRAVKEELRELRDLIDEIGGTGVTRERKLVPDDFFDAKWAQGQFREKYLVGSTVNLNEAWPFSLVDWDDAAGVRLDDLGYIEVDFNDVTWRVVPL